MQKLLPSEFPKRFLHISDPPKQLFIKGTLPDFKTHTYICIVGSRKHSPYGKDVCERIIEILQPYPVVIVSGLAFGIDKIAHEHALRLNIKTVALPGSGLHTDVLYPAHHRMLAEKILQNNGALISELEPMTPGAHWTFPRRNRLMAAIADIIIVIEAQKKSGTKITATYGAEYGKDVFAVPGSIFSPTSQGTHELIADGATPLIDTQFLLEELGFTQISQPAKELNCTEHEREILNLLLRPLGISDIIRKIALPTSTTRATIMQLEIKGLVKESDGVLRRIA
jgi:DNA processing protein